MSSSAGLADSAKRARIIRKAVRPPVASRPLPTVAQAEAIREPLDSLPEVPELEVSRPKVEENVERVTSEAQTETADKKVPKKKAVIKKIGHTQPRFEVRLSGDHEKLVEEIQRKAFKETLPANKGINNSELFGGFLEAIRPYRKDLSFSSLSFKRGKLYGEGTERIKIEIGRIIQRSTFEYLLSAIEAGDDEVVRDVLQNLTPERREKILAQIITISQQIEEQRLAANS